jgi:hypothetical protein
VAETTEKTLDLSGVKLFRARTILSEHCSPWAVLVVNPIPVLNDENTLLGWASVTTEGYRCFADLALNYATPERLSIETKAQQLFAHPKFLDPLDQYHFDIIAIVLSTGAYWPDQPAIGEAVL